MMSLLFLRCTLETLNVRSAIISFAFQVKKLFCGFFSFHFNKASLETCPKPVIPHSPVLQCHTRRPCKALPLAEFS